MLLRLPAYFLTQWTSLGNGAMTAMLAAREARHSVCVDLREEIIGFAAGIGRVRWLCIRASIFTVLVLGVEWIRETPF